MINTSKLYYEHFQSLGSFEKASFVLGSELW